MSFFSSLIKAIFIISLAFPLCCEAGLTGTQTALTDLMCNEYKDPTSPCPEEHEPVCATDGETYDNPCAFCAKVIQSDEPLLFYEHGDCDSD